MKPGIGVGSKVIEAALAGFAGLCDAISVRIAKYLKWSY